MKKSFNMNFIILVLVIVFNSQVLAFEKEMIKYENGSNKELGVKFIFTGKNFDVPLNLLQKKIVKDKQVRYFQSFFKDLYWKNKEGAKKDILTLWNPIERKVVEQGMDEKSLDQNKTRFQAMDQMKLKLIIEYGNYYICYIENSFFNGAKYVMKFPLIKLNDNLYLTNKLNGDYFYDAISHHLDSSNFYNAKQQ